ALAVAFSLLVSLVVAIVLVPVLAARWTTGGRREARAPSRLDRWLTTPRGARARELALWPFETFNRHFTRFAERYEQRLAWALDHRGRVVGAGLFLFASALTIAVFLPRSVLPDVDQGAF